ncbi:hypothetical protein Ancab_014234 [Ancistrocladus abbreviatus]
MALDVQYQQPPQPALVSDGAAPFSVISGGAGLAHNPRRPPPVTLDLFHTKSLEHLSPDWLHIKGKCLESPEIMSQRNGKGPKLDLKLNLSPPRAPRAAVESPSRSASLSPPSSCVSSEEDSTLRYSNSPEATSMVLVGCPRCLMYVMLSQDDPKCPKCKSTVLLDFLHEATTTTSSTATATVFTADKKTRKS